MLSQISTLSLSPNATWQEVETRYKQLSEFWSPERFSHDSNEMRIAEFRLKEIKRAFHQLSEQKELFNCPLSRSHSSVFQSLGKLRLCHKRSRLKSTRRDVHRNLRVGRILNLVAGLFPILQPAPWGRKKLSGNIDSKIKDCCERTFSVVTAPVEILVRVVLGGAHHVQMQLLFVLLLFLVFSEARMQIQAEGGVKSREMTSSQEERNSYVLRSVFQIFKGN